MPHRLTGLLRILALLLAAFLCQHASSQVTQKSEDTATDAKKRAALALSIKCVRLLDRHQADWYGGVQAESDRLADIKGRREAASSLLQVCELPAAAGGSDSSAFAQSVGPADLTLSGVGSLVIYVTAQTYDTATSEAKKDGRTLRLYLNGFEQGADGQLIANERIGELVRLSFRLNRGSQSKTLWTALYREYGISTETPLRVGLGWSGVSGPTSSIPSAYEETYRIRVSSSTSVATSALWVLALFAGAFYVLVRTDTFRDFPVQEFWADARQLRRQLAWAGVVNRSRARVDQQTQSDVAEGTIRKSAFASVFSSDRLRAGEYREAAIRALAGEVVTEGNRAETVIGLSLLNYSWRPVRATYSLARVQVGVWFVFVVATAVFLRVVYGELPEISATMLALAGLSVATATASMAVDASIDRPSFLPSRGLFLDIVTGPDNKQQLHRFQSVVINVLLLSLGVLEVVNELAYPTFDGTWLTLLGLSGAAFAVGKQLTEATPSSNISSGLPTKQDNGSPKGSGQQVAEKPLTEISSDPTI